MLTLLPLEAGGGAGLAQLTRRTPAKSANEGRRRIDSTHQLKGCRPTRPILVSHHPQKEVRPDLGRTEASGECETLDGLRPFVDPPDRIGSLEWCGGREHPEAPERIAQ